jgi:hypothetical protein
LYQYAATLAVRKWPKVCLAPISKESTVSEFVNGEKLRTVKMPML